MNNRIIVILKMATPTLVTLPPEIITLILEEVNFDDLASIMLVCKCLNPLAREEQVRREREIYDWDGWDDECGWWDQEVEYDEDF